MSLFNFFENCTDFGYFSDLFIQGNFPYFYHAYSESGYYSYVATPFLEYMRVIKEDTVSHSLILFDFIPTPEFDSGKPYEVLSRIKKSNPKMIHIVGGKDPWGATKIDVSEMSNSMLIIDPNGCHLTRINNLPDSLRNKTISLLDKWLK